MSAATRILLIENDVPSMEYMFHLLTTYGYFPVRARNGEEGLMLAARERPALIVSDLAMPVLDGFELARRVKANPELKDIPMIALSAFSIPEDRRKALDAGFDGYIHKPVSPEIFMRHIEAFLPPKHRAGPAFAGGPAANSAAARAIGHKVLVVDDTPVNLKLASMLLGGAGYEVATARGMSEGLRLAREDRPDLILSDIVMSDGSGFEFIRAVKNDVLLRSIPFVFNTASMTVESARRKCLALGAAKVLFRPMNPAEMLREIAACLDSGLTVGACRFKSAQDFEAYLGTVPEAAYVCDSTGLITFFNAKAVDTWGRTPKLRDASNLWCGSHSLYFSDGAPMSHEQCWMAKAIRSKTALTDKPIIVERPDSTRVAALANLWPIYDDSHSLYGAVNIVVPKESSEAIQAIARFRG